MNFSRVVRLLSVAGILLAGLSERTEAKQAAMGYCFICANFGNCPADDGASLCAANSCPTNAGCVENFGNCPVAIGCNEPS
jgi:hypothetical protein